VIASTVEIQIPQLFADLLPMTQREIAIEHAPLYGRFSQFVLAELFQVASTYVHQEILILTRRVAMLQSQIDKWLDNCGVKTRKRNNGLCFTGTGSSIYIVNPDGMNINDFPFTLIDRLVVCEAETIPQPLFQSLRTLVRAQIVCISVYGTEDDWFYRWARSGATLHRFPANEIIVAFPDQCRRYEELKAAFSPNEIARHLNLQDVQVLSRKKAKYLLWVLDIMPAYCELPPSKMHQEMDGIFAHMTNKRKLKIVIEGPRDSAKSTHGAEGFVLYSVCHAMETYILIISDTTEQACKHLDVIKEELVSNELVAERYPDCFGEGPVWKNNAIETRNGIRIEALGAGKKIRGRRFKNHRPSLIVGDDLEGDEAIHSAKMREHRLEWFLKGVMKAGGPNTNFLVLGSRLQSSCLVAKLAASPGWDDYLYKSIIKFPHRMDLWAEWERILRDVQLDRPAYEARVFYEGHKEDMDAGADILWKEREDLYTLMLMRATDGHAAFESEKQNNPIDPTKCEWSPILFEDRWFTDWPENLRVVVGALDPSKGKSDKIGDYQGMVAVGIDDKLRIYVDADITRRPMTEMCDAYANFLNNVGASVGVCEADQFQELLLPEIEDSTTQALMTCNIEPITTQSINKNLRIRRLGPWINRGRCLFRRGSPGIQLLIQQLCEFPNSDHDDGPDAFEMALRRALEALNVTVEDLRNPL